MSGEGGSKEAKKPAQEIFDGFKRLREEQRLIMAKISELDAERNEHAIVMETLAATEGDRTGFRLLNGVLVQSTVANIRPSLQSNFEQVPHLPCLPSSYKSGFVGFSWGRRWRRSKCS